MRISSIWHYHISTSWRSLALLSAIVLAVFIAILLMMTPFMAAVSTHGVSIGTGEVIVSNTEMNKPTLSEPFGTSSTIYTIFMIVFASISITADRRYLLSNNVTRYEFILGTFASVITMAVLLTGIEFVLDLIIRIVTYSLGFTIRGMVWTPQLVMFSASHYVPDLIAGIGNLIAMAGALTLIVLLFARWKKTCITLCVLGILLPIVMINFLPANWLDWLLENAASVYKWLSAFLEQNQWLFLIGASWYHVLIQQTIVGAALYGLSYLVIRRLPVRTK